MRAFYLHFLDPTHRDTSTLNLEKTGKKPRTKCRARDLFRANVHGFMLKGPLPHSRGQRFNRRAKCQQAIRASDRDGSILDPIDPRSNLRSRIGPRIT